MTNTNETQNPFDPIPLYSEIINEKKQFIFKIDQDTNYIYPNQEYEYIVYCKNASNSPITNIHIQIINPENVLIDEDDFGQGVEIGTLNQQESHLLRIKAKCSTIGTFTVHFLCYGDGTGLFTKQLTINCDYNLYNAETIHKIHVYNFTPYEEKYLLKAQDYNEDVVRLHKIQKLPYKAKENPFGFITIDYNQGIIVDESQNYIDQKNELYGNPYNTDEHNYQYIGRENFNKDSVEHFEGRNLIDIINQINDKSKLFKATFLKTGTNELLNDFKPYNPNGFIYRFGLMSSELFHYLGVLPEYSYMNDVLFRWAPDNTEPLNIYPKKVAMKWNTKRWAGHGYHVYKTYTDEYKNEIINNQDFTPLFEFIRSFDLLETAEEYIKKEYEFDTTNIYYIQTEEGLSSIKKYQYIIKESYFDNGVFYIHIPIDKIPSNFFIPSTEEIEAIIQKTKPYGLKPLIRYISTVRFNHNMSLNTYTQLKPNIQFHLGYYDRIRYAIQSLKYNNIIETICNNTRETIRLVPDGKLVNNLFHIKHNQDINIYMDKPKDVQDIKVEMDIQNEPKECEISNDLSILSNLEDLLYQNNFENISFMMDQIPVSQIKDEQQGVPTIDAIDYKLWIQSLEDTNHSRKWEVEIPRQNYFGDLSDPNNPNKKYFNGKINKYYISDQKTPNNCLSGQFNFVKISLINKQIIRPNIETGIGFKDITGKLHGISAEYDSYYQNFSVRYTTSTQNIFKTHKKIISDLSGLAYKIIIKDSSTIVIFFIEKQDENKHITYHYFHHIIIPPINQIFCFVRNEKNISTIEKISNIVFIGSDNNTQIYFNTPQYFNNIEYDPNIIITDNINSWENITRIDKNEHSYAIKHNITNETQEVDDIKLHFDNINIPEDAIIKDINIHAILETNTNKSIYYSLRNQDGFITPESSVNKITSYPSNIETYPVGNHNQEYYQEQYNIAISNNLNNNAKSFQKKIEENQYFNDILDFSTDFLDNYDDKITIKKPYWCEFSDFINEDFSFNDIEDCYFVLEGYNHGAEVTLISQLSDYKSFGNTSEILIPSGHFIKHIPLHFLKQFILSNICLRLRFQSLNDKIDIFDIYLNTIFNDKKDTNVAYNDYKIIEVENKKIIDLGFIDQDELAYNFKNGFTIKLEFDDLEPGEYYRIYSVVLNITYQAQSIDFLANKDHYRNNENENYFVTVGGQQHDTYLSGMFFNDIPSAFQYLSTSNIDNPGMKLSDALYQSFIAEHDNITSITLYPNGFIGNPSLNLKLSLYTNQGHTPNRLIKEINVNGWSKANDTLKNQSMVTYNFNVNNLKIGETYWIKIEVQDPSEDNYYLLKYIDSPQPDLKLLIRNNNNLINAFGSLKFQVNSIHLYKSFNNIPISQDDLSNPNVFIGLNRGQGYIKNLRVKTQV